VGGQLATAADAVRGAVARTSRAVLNTVFMLIALFFFLVDGRRLLRWLEEVSPLERGKFQEIALEVRQAVVSVLLSTLVTAAIQAAFALAAYLIARVPQPFFFGLVTFLFALVPVIGAASITVAVAVLMLATGHTGAAIFLFVWGLAVVGLVDNLVKPWLIKDRVRLHGAVVFFALMGGLLMFGVKGLIAGPLIVAFFVAVLRVFSRPDSRLTYPSASPGDVDVAPSPAG
jgi:predicted PurR-regulated permease PerM